MTEPLSPSAEPLGERRIVDAALAVARRDGLDQVTMRGLARHFGVTTMAIHYHVPTREALLSLVVERVLGQVEAPPDGPWEDRLRAVHRRLSAAVSDCPGVADYLVDITRTRHGTRLADLATGILLDAGFDERTTVLAQATTQAYWVGYLKLAAGFQRRGGPPARHQTADDPQIYPALDRVALARSALDAETYLEFALDVIIAGFRGRRSAPGR
ncbi:TetR/AcrR family transcriptional regulator [Frankia sp. Cas3]|uniref:TetR/AcrR family transcriptional regulator n=1 Tax=Frankia sp. Cas3 TaxID=3073926 RepID=UPI002AD56A9F|nr:TetR/AcrR family transcriptional regulator [Frankia sp. Cas3]